MATLKSKNGVLDPQIPFFFTFLLQSWYVGYGMTEGSCGFMVTSNSQQKKSYGHLKVPKRGFGPLDPSFFYFSPSKLVCGYIAYGMTEGSCGFMMTSNSHQEHSYGQLKVQKSGFGPLTPSVCNSAPPKLVWRLLASMVQYIKKLKCEKSIK